MRTIRPCHLLLVLALLGALTIASIVNGILGGTIDGYARPTASCQEDDPCWDCHTMGNLICGPVRP